MSFAKRLRYYRKQKKLRQTEVAEKAGVTTAAYNKYETKGFEPNYETLMKLARVLGVDVNTLLGYEKEKPGTIGQSYYKELIQVITEARGLLLDLAEVEPDGSSETVRTVAAVLKLTESGLDIAKCIYTAYLERENKKLSDSLMASG